jgi:hypothetical protein
MTDESRRNQIEKGLAARAEQPEAERRSHPLPWRGSERYFPVIDLPLNVPLLNADSHRVRAELELPDYAFVRKERTTDRAQEVLTHLWKKAHRKYEELKESLAIDGQTEPGAITRAGVLINGNTRLVALRELQYPDRQWLKVAVLDSAATPLELAQLELRLQVRKDMRDPYRLSNELLFIEELAREYEMADEQIAAALNWNPSKPAVGKKKVQQYRRILQLIREMQSRDPKLPITFFDDEGGGPGKFQQLRELEQKYSELLAVGETEQARLLLQTWLVVARGGFPSVHQIRAVTQREDFVAEYLLPRLGEQELFGERAEALVRGKGARKADLPGLGELGSDEDNGSVPASYDLKPLLRLVESKDAQTVTLPGDDAVQVEAQQVKAAIRAAIDGAIRDYRAEDKAEDELNAPVDALRNAGRELNKATTAYAELRDTKEFQRSTRGAFEYQMKQLRRHVKKLEDLIAGKGKSRA